MERQPQHRAGRGRRCCWTAALASALLAVISCSPVTTAVALDQRSMTLFPQTAEGWNVSVAKFGSQFGAERTGFHLMYPPEDDDGFLCTPLDLSRIGLGSEFGIGKRRFRIGLLVKDGMCSAEDKARVALNLQQQIPHIHYLVVYGTDPAKPGANTLYASSNPVPPDFRSIGLLYLPYSEANRLREAIQTSASQYGVDPHLLGATNDEWKFQVRVSGPENPTRDNDDDSVNRLSNQQVANFYWFRFILFGLLIISPCIRAAYLWYTGGGRMHWRRNENGRIIGIQYIPPMPYWLGSGRLPAVENTISDVLTEEQFASLPEIKFVPIDPTEHAANENEILLDESIVEDPDLTVTPELVESSDELNEEESACVKDLELQISTDEEAEQDLEESSSGQVSQVHTAHTAIPGPSIPLSPSNLGSQNFLTTCTVCSICIDDFEENETLTLLPRCRHAFHKDCIHPWLMERQGCCPLCKTKVLADDAETDQSESGTGSNQEQQDMSENDDVFVAAETLPPIPSPMSVPMPIPTPPSSNNNGSPIPTRLPAE